MAISVLDAEDATPATKVAGSRPPRDDRGVRRQVERDRHRATLGSSAACTMSVSEEDQRDEQRERQSSAPG